MKISELIEKLEAIKQEKGDVQVIVAFAGAPWSIFDIFTDKNDKEECAVLDIEEYCSDVRI